MGRRARTSSQGHVDQASTTRRAARSAAAKFSPDVQQRRQPEHDPRRHARRPNRSSGSPPTWPRPNLLSPAGGAVCWEALDCVSWGNFSGTLPSSGRPPARPAGIPDGMALRRTIAAGCATLLEAGDDTHNSAADFDAVFPGPRPNSVPPTEHACGGRRRRGGGGPGKRAPRRPSGASPPKKTPDRTPTFRFTSDDDRRDLRMQARRQALQRLPLALHDASKLSLRQAHLQGPRQDRQRQVDPLAGLLTASRSR